MPQVGVQRLGSGGAEEHGSENQKPSGVIDKDFHRIPWVERLEYLPVGSDVADAEHTHHQKPQQHQWSETFADGRGAELLGYEYHRDDAESERYHWWILHYRRQTLHRGCHGDGRGYHSVGDKGAGSDGCQNVKPLLPFLFYQRIEGQDAAFTLVVGPQGNQHIFQCGLQRERPDNERHGSDDKIGTP